MSKDSKEKQNLDNTTRFFQGKKYKKSVSHILIITMLICSIIQVGGFQSFEVYGATNKLGSTVRIMQPDFKVTLNGEEINNLNNQYPLMVYKDITYFPMTYMDCRFLGIESIWTGNELFIDTTGITAAYDPYSLLYKPLTYGPYEIDGLRGYTYMASIPSFSVTVNGEKIDMAKEEYPLLSFRDITYFPLTWKFAVDAFSWDYSFDAKNGLVIQSDNKRIEQITIKKGSSPDNAIVSGGYAYYSVYEDKKVYQAPLLDMHDAKSVFEWDWEEAYVDLSVADGRTLLNYRVGSSLIGGGWLAELKDNGKMRLLNNRGQSGFARDMIFNCDVRHGGYSGNLTMKTLDEKEYDYKDMPLEQVDTGKKIGSDQFWYNGILNEGESQKVNLVDDKLCVRADGNIYSVNIKTNETVKLNQKELDNGYYAVTEDDFFYYVSGGNVYKGNIKSNGKGVETSIGSLNDYREGAIGSPFAVHGGKAYWRGIDSGVLYVTGVKEGLNVGANLINMETIGDNGEYLACYFDETQSARYRLALYDKEGNEAFVTSDVARSGSATVEGKTLYYYNLGTETICKVQL